MNNNVATIAGKAEIQTRQKGFLDVPLCKKVFESTSMHWGGESVENCEQSGLFGVSVYLCQNSGCPPNEVFRSFTLNNDICYHGFCDDFGPMNMRSVMDFIRLLDDEIRQNREYKIHSLVFNAENGRRILTNSAFLLGAYMMFTLKTTPEDVNAIFEDLDEALFEGYRDATYSTPDFRLSLIDCWQGLHRGMMLGWVALPKSACSFDWGMIDQDFYQHYDNPLNADMHEVVPNKFVAFRGPRDLGGRAYSNDPASNSREFSPSYFADIFHDIHVSTVVRLNEALYSPSAFTNRGIQHFDLYFDDCTNPPADIVRLFFRIVDAAADTVAVHCKAGLGRTGTLIALYLMRTHGFAAREAIGWLRIMRPGSVIGSQQRFLCQVDLGMRSRAALGRLPASPVSAAAWAGRAGAAASACRRRAHSAADTPQQEAREEAPHTAGGGGVGAWESLRTSPAAAAPPPRPRSEGWACALTLADAPDAAAGGGGAGGSTGLHPQLADALAAAELGRQVAEGLLRRDRARARAAEVGGSETPPPGGEGANGGDGRRAGGECRVVVE